MSFVHPRIVAGRRLVGEEGVFDCASVLQWLCFWIVRILSLLLILVLVQCCRYCSSKSIVSCLLFPLEINLVCICAYFSKLAFFCLFPLLVSSSSSSFTLCSFCHDQFRIFLSFIIIIIIINTTLVRLRRFKQCIQKVLLHGSGQFPSITTPVQVLGWMTP